MALSVGLVRSFEAKGKSEGEKADDEEEVEGEVVVCTEGVHAASGLHARMVAWMQGF